MAACSFNFIVVLPFFIGQPATPAVMILFVEPDEVDASAAEAAVRYRYGPWISDFLRQRWGSVSIAVHGEIIDASRLPALVAEPQRGLATYRRLGDDAELVTLDAAPAGIGTGTALLDALTRRLCAEGCARLWLSMTNGNLSALQFYLRRGFRLAAVRPGAADAARRLKPSIPTVGEAGIAVRDEFDLYRALSPAAENVSAQPPWSRRAAAMPKPRLASMRLWRRLR
jgi:GNAT superfamily N-acetyltransferase